MAGDWIKMRKTLLADPRIVRIMSALKADRFRTIGGLFSAWCLADDQTEDGELDGYTPELLDELVGFPGLARAMEAAGWLEVRQNSIVFPRFTEHNGKSAKRRAQDGVRKLSAREADKKRTREEKRREEKNTSLTIPAELAEDWERWQSFRDAQDGARINDIQAAEILMELGRRGAQKAKEDIAFSIRIGAKNIRDSRNDYDAQKPSNRGGGKTPSFEEGLL